MTEQNINKHHTAHRKWFGRLKWLTIVVLVLAGIVLMVLPYGIKFAIKQALMESCAGEVFIRDVDFNPFAGKLEVHGLSAQDSGNTLMDAPELMLEISWIPLLQKKVLVTQLTVSDTNVVVEHMDDGTWMTGGFVPPASTPERKGESLWNFGIERLNVTKSSVTIKSPELNAEVHIIDFTVTDLATWKPQQPAVLDFSGRVNDGVLSIRSRMVPFSDSPWIKGEVKLDGLSLKPFERISSDIKELDGELSIESEIEAKQLTDSSIDITHQGSVRLSRTVIQSGAADVRTESFKWDGKFDFSRKDSMNNFQLSGDIKLTGLTVTAPEQEIKLAELNQVDIKQLIVENTQDIGISQVKSDRILIGRRLEDGKAGDVPLFKVSSAALSDLRIKDLKDIMIQSIELRDAEAFLLINNNGKLRLVEDILDIPGKKVPDKQETVQTTTVKVANIQIAGNSSLRFEDESVTPPFRTNLALGKLQIQDVDSMRPERQSPFTLEGKIDDYSLLLISGDLKPFAKRLTLHLNGKLEEFDMPALSSYTSKLLGYSLVSGHLNAEVEMRIAEGKMDGTNSLLLRNLKVSPQDDNKIKQLTSQLTISLDSALSLLRDRDNNIKLTLPVHGDVTDPKFDMGSIINKALGNAIKKAAMTYLKLSFQPYGALITVVEIAGKAARLRLDPVFFEPGSSDLNSAAFDYLDRVAGLMKERPQMEISLCGKIVPGDIAALSEEAAERPPVQGGNETARVSQEDAAENNMPVEVTEEQKDALARKRASLIKSHLVEQYNIESERLFICNPETDSKEGARPRTELLI